MDRKNTTTFGKNLQKYRKLRDLTQLELAEASGFSRTYIGELEQGTKEPSYAAAKKLAKVLAISMDQISYDAEEVDVTKSYYLQEASIYLEKMNAKQKKLADSLGLKILEEISNLPDG